MGFFNFGCVNQRKGGGGEKTDDGEAFIRRVNMSSRVRELFASNDEVRRNSIDLSQSTYNYWKITFLCEF